MSKSLKNYPDPMELANRTGIDAMRFYLLSSPVVRGEDLNFSEKEVLELQRKNIGRLHNVLAMYDMFKDGTKGSASSTNVLDRWILACLQELINDSTSGYRGYELDKAVRPVTDFIDNLSVWYLRRSRDRFKGDDTTDKALALATLRYVLQNLSLVMAPVMPFYAEYLWLAVKEDDAAESVHLGKWPETKEIDVEILNEMKIARDVTSFALEARTSSKINVRQPISTITAISIPVELQNIVLSEVNAKEYIVGDAGITGVYIDTTLTPELIAEGNVRELMRAVQGRRKTEGLAPQDVIILTIATSETGKLAIEANRDMFVKTVGASELIFADTDGEVVVTDSEQFVFKITKL